jgi:hypothetical protein
MTDALVSDRPEQHRYVISRGEQRAGLLFYRLEGERITFTHAEIDPAFEGQGLGSQLARFALDDARSRGLAVIPRCPFVESYVERHPEYADLVPADERQRSGL